MAQLGARVKLMPIAFRLSSSCNGLTVSTMSGGGVLAAVDGTVKTAGEVRQTIQDTLAMRSFQQRLLLNDRIVEEDDTSLRTKRGRGSLTPSTRGTVAPTASQSRRPVTNGGA